jgi:tetratricopeptide (TPR) repeat protein
VVETLADAIAAHNANDFVAAERGYKAFPDRPVARHNLGALYFSTGRLDEAEAAFRSALELTPGQPVTEHNLSFVLLAQGRFAEGWALFERRRDDPSGVSRLPAMPCPEWQGQSLAGKRLVVVSEQGFGDQIMFARFLPLAAAQAAEVVFVATPELATLFQALPVRVVAGLARSEAAAMDLWAPLLSLPHRLGVTGAPLPPPFDAGLAMGAGGGVGVMARGRPMRTNNGERSLPDALAERLLRLGRDLHPDATGAKDFRETAQLMAGLDLIVSVDTSAAHLAASLGKPTIVLLPGIGLDWRWYPKGRESPWYPSATLLHQAANGDWTQALAEAEAAVGRLA